RGSWGPAGELGRTQPSELRRLLCVDFYYRDLGIEPHRWPATPSLTTGKMIASGSSTSPSAALSNQTANLFSDLLVHHMGQGLADGITQGGAGPDEFRTAPLWGVGQRVFFLHDGRTTNLVEAIRAHKSRVSEANKVIEHFDKLSIQEQQEIIDFLRSL